MTRTHEFHLTGAARKPLIEAIESFTNTKGVYQGAPKFGYAFHGVGVLDKAGALHLDCDLQVIMDLITWLENCGFACDTAETPESRTYQAELSDPDCPDRMEVFGAEDDADAIQQAREFCESEIVLLELFELDDDYNQIRGVDLSEFPTGLTIEFPIEGFTPDKLDNLRKLIAAKAPLIKAALGKDELPIIQLEDRLQFPWFPFPESEQANAYGQFICALCTTALKKNRVTAKEKDTDGSPKYAMRCFLLSIGMIGDDYKAARKLLLKNLDGSSAFKSGKKGGTDDE